MNYKLHAAGAALLAVGLVASSAYAQSKTAVPAKKTATKKSAAPAKPSTSDQIQALREELQKEISGLKSDLAAKDSELKQAQQSANAAQAAAAKAQAAATAQNEAVNSNAAAVNSLQSTVEDMKGSNASMAANVSEALSTSAKKSQLSDLAFGKVKIGATLFGDYSMWTDWDGKVGGFYDNQKTPTSISDKNFNTFEITRAYLNVVYTPSDAVSVRITPDIVRDPSGVSTNYMFRLKYAYIDFNSLFKGFKYFKNAKLTFGQTQNSLTDWEDGLTGHRYTYKSALDYSGIISSTYVGVKVRAPFELNGKTYADLDLGVYTNGSYSSVEKSGTKQFMGRATYYPLGTKKERTGLGVTVFGNVAFNNTNPNDTDANRYALDRLAIIGHYQTANKGYMIAGEFDLAHNALTSVTGYTGAASNITNASATSAVNNQQRGFAFMGNARLGGKKSPFHAFGIYQYLQPNTYVDAAKFAEYSRTVGGIAYKFNNNLDIAIGDSNYHWVNPNSSNNLNDTNVVSVFTQYNF